VQSGFLKERAGLLKLDKLLEKEILKIKAWTKHREIAKSQQTVQYSVANNPQACRRVPISGPPEEQKAMWGGSRIIAVTLVGGGGEHRGLKGPCRQNKYPASSISPIAPCWPLPDVPPGPWTMWARRTVEL